MENFFFPFLESQSGKGLLSMTQNTEVTKDKIDILTTLKKKSMFKKHHHLPNQKSEEKLGQVFATYMREKG